MKTESTKILIDVTSHIAKHMTDAMTSSETEKASDFQWMLAQIGQVFRMETPASSTKFDLWKCVSKEENLRPQMCCIFHDNGYKVASDARILVALKESYGESFEGQLLKKDGSFLQGEEGRPLYKYPDWRSVIPQNNETVRKINISKYYDGLREFKTSKKLGTTATADGYVKIHIDPSEESEERGMDIWFNSSSFKNFADFMKEFGISEIKVSDNARKAVLAESGESRATLMPVVGLDEDTEKLMSKADIIIL